jgi:AraC-like DNA-binding protein
MVDAGHRCRIKLYELRLRKKVTIPFSTARSEIGLVFMLRGSLRVTIGALQLHLSDSNPCIGATAAGITKYQFPAGIYTILYVTLKHDFLISHCLTQPIIKQLLACCANRLLHFTPIPFSFKMQFLINALKGVLSEHLSDVALSSCLFEAKLMELIVESLREITAHQSSVTVEPGKNADALDRYVSYLNTNFHMRITLADAAKDCGAPRARMEKIFKKQFGQNPSEYLSELRLSKAKHFLETTTLTLTQIASYCGFANESALSGAFQGRYNCLPLVFRARLKSIG